jgi:hypothetical protein
MHAKLALGILALLPAATPVFGYTDPGSGLMLWQILGAVLFGLMFQIRRALVRFRPGKRNTQQR